MSRLSAPPTMAIAVVARVNWMSGPVRPVHRPPSRLTTLRRRAEVRADILLDTLPGGLTFESVRSRGIPIALGEVEIFAASLDDVIRSKEVAGRPKDLAQLPVLRDTLRVRDELGR